MPTLHNPFPLVGKSQPGHRARSDSDGFSSDSASSLNSPLISASPSPSTVSSTQSSPTSSNSNKNYHIRNGGGGNRLSRFYQRSKPFGRFRFLLRRRPSSADLALREEQSRCTEDSIERIGLDLMEPRPVEPLPTVVDVTRNNDVYGNIEDVLGSNNIDDAWVHMSSRRHHPPRCVMGGIFEVMEGTA